MTDRILAYDLVLAYASGPDDRQILPRIQVAARFYPGQARNAIFRAVLDTGAEASVFDGSLAVRAGWTMRAIEDGARGTGLIYGIGSTRPIPAYLHEVVCHIGGPMAFARMKLRVLITPPDTLEFPVLGRSDFFQQVDVTFADFDRMLYLRFRDPAVLQR